jgi:hypothetical protein
MNLLEKGNFVEINDTFLTRSLDAFQGLARIQEEFGKNDTDTFMNEVRDSIAAKYLKYTHINIEKHGLDARRKSLQAGFDYDYLEVKTASFEANSWQATFNDTNLEKAGLFTQRNVYLALSVWKGAADLLFIVYGQNPQLGEFLRKKVENFLSGNGGVRSTQSVPISKLVNDFGMDIFAVNKTPNELYNLFQMKNGCRTIRRSSIRTFYDNDHFIVAEPEAKYLFEDNEYLMAAEGDIEYKAQISKK